MNWTGGRLSRHSHTKSGALTARQKQHFAKVQSNQRNNVENGARSLSILGHALKDCRQPSVLKEDNQIHTQGNYRSSRDQDDRTTSRMYSRTHESQQFPQGIRTSMIKVERAITPDDDLYDATPPPRVEKRKRETPHVTLEQHDTTQDCSASDKRRKLLRKGNWVGTNIQQPIQLAFAYPTHGADIGRRRKVLDGHRVQYASKQMLVTSPFTKRQRVHSPQLLKIHGIQRTKTDVRISIGGRVVPPGISSSTVPSRYQCHSERTHEQEFSQRGSSDVMLLDNNTPNRNHLYNQSFDPSGHSGRLEGIEIHSRESPEGNQGPNTEESDLEQFSGGIRSQSGSPDQTNSLPRDGYHRERSISKQAILESPVSEFFTSSSAAIHHPKPHSSRISLLLRSSSSEIAESTTAQVGPSKPVVPPSQALDHDIWETWITTLEDEQDISGLANMESSARLERQVAISPGISAIPLNLPSAKPTASPKTNQRLAVHSTANEFQGSGDRKFDSLLPHDEPAEANQGPNGTTARPVAEFVQDLSGGISRLHEIVPAEIISSKRAKRSNSDDLWRKFVFDDSSDNDGNIGNEFAEFKNTRKGGKFWTKLLNTRPLSIDEVASNERFLDQQIDTRTVHKSSSGSGSDRSFSRSQQTTFETSGMNSRAMLSVEDEDHSSHSVSSARSGRATLGTNLGSVHSSMMSTAASSSIKPRKRMNNKTLPRAPKTGTALTSLAVLAEKSRAMKS